MYLDYNGMIPVPISLILKIGLKSAYQYVMLSSNYKTIPGKLPTKRPNGAPNPGVRKYPNGNPFQERVYGPDDKALVDHDHHEGEDIGYDHDHDWSWDGDTPTRGPARKPDPNKIAAVGTLVVSTLALVWLVGNDVSGIGVADDVAIPVVATTFVATWLILIGEGDNNKW